MSFKQMSELGLSGQRVLIRQDLNVPIKDGKVTSDARIRAALPTLKAALDAGARVMVMSHLGRPKEGEVDEEHSLAPVAAYLSKALGQDVPLAVDWIDGISVEPGQLTLCENVRFQTGEKANDGTLSRKMAALCDIYVNDAFGTAHRSHASVCGVAEFAPVACAGPLMAAELEALGSALKEPKRPLVVIVGGAKVSTKLELLRNLSHVADKLVLGGGIANTFLAAAGHYVGSSLFELDLIQTATLIRREIERRGGSIPLPDDVIAATELSDEARAETRGVDEVEEDEMILDLGPVTLARIKSILDSAGTIVWNGPLGVFEVDQFGGGTQALAKAVADSPAYSIAGGGDTLAAIEKYGVESEISYISTGGGAFLEYLEGKTLPAVAMLESRAA